MGCLRCISRVKSFHVKILLLDKQELIQEVTEKTTGQDLLDKVFKYLNLIETAYFGLRYQDNDNQTHWLDPKKQVCRQIRGISPFTLYLGVKFYAADPCRLVEEITRYQFFLQVKQDVLQGRLPVNPDLAVELAALALQSEVGDFDPKQHYPGYVSEFRFIGAQTEEFESDVQAAHASMTGMGIVPATAEMTYLEKVKWLDMYGVDLHPVIGEDNIEYFLGLTPSGIIVLRNRTKVGNYFWPRITKIYFKGKYFMLRVRDKNNDDSTYGFETPSRQACKHLWKCCVEHHAFFRLVQVSPSFVGTGVFSLGSRFRYSGHTEKQVMQQVQSVRRQQPQFVRRPSNRRLTRSTSQIESSSIVASAASEYDQRKSSTSELRSPVVLSSLANGSLKRQSASTGPKSPSNHRSSSHHQHRTNSLPRHVSMVASSIMRNQMNNNVISSGNGGDESLQDLSLQSLQWLESRGLYETTSKQNSRRASLPEQIQANGYYRPRRSHNNGGGGQSDAESDASGISWASGLQSSHRRRNESGSESERSVRRTHRSRRKRQGSYKLVETDEQWQAMQHRKNNSESGEHHHQQQQAQSHHSSRKSGYVNSGAETEADTTSHASIKRNRRRQRSRSRSPGESRARLPPEVLQQLEFGLVEPNDESLRGDIPFKQVETNGFKPHYNAAQIRQTSKTRSLVDQTQLNSPSSNNHHHQLRNSSQQQPRFNRGSETASMVLGGPPVTATNGHMPRQAAGNHRPPPPPQPLPPPPPNSQAQPQFDSHRNNDSPSSNQFVWPANYLATSTPVTSSSITPVPAANHSPARNYHHHHMVGLPVASTQYRSPYAVPQSSSGSSASTRDPAPPPLPGLPPQTSSSFMPPTNYVTHALPPTILNMPQRSPQMYENSKLNGDGMSGGAPHHPPAMYSKYIQQSRVGQLSQGGLRSNGFVPSGDEMSTEL